MNCRLLLLICLALPVCLLAQRKSKPSRPTLLVYGEGLEAFTAAMQAALSNAPTLWVIPASTEETLESGAAMRIPAGAHIDGGIWMKLLMEVGKHPFPSDSVAAEVKKQITPAQLRAASQRLLEKVPHLTILEQTTVNKISRARRGWQVSLSNRKRYNLHTVVDASKSQDLAGRIAADNDLQATPRHPALKVNTIQRPAFARTTLAVGENDGEIHSLIAADLFNGVKDNFFSLWPLSTLTRKSENLALRAHVAQAIGATAAYTAYFKTTTDKIDVRKLQSELMTYHSRLLPLVDIRTEDSNFSAVQRMYLAGIFTFEDDNFDERKPVGYAEIRPVLNQLYSRSQLWFMEHEGNSLNWKEAIDLIKFIGLRGAEVDRYVADNWATTFQVDGAYDPDRAITRKEFAVLLDRFANPYGISVTHAGEIRR